LSLSTSLSNFGRAFKISGDCQQDAAPARLRLHPARPLPYRIHLLTSPLVGRTRVPGTPSWVKIFQPLDPLVLGNFVTLFKQSYLLDGVLCVLVQISYYRLKLFFFFSPCIR